MPYLGINFLVITLPFLGNLGSGDYFLSVGKDKSKLLSQKHVLKRFRPEPPPRPPPLTYNDEKMHLFANVWTI